MRSRSRKMTLAGRLIVRSAVVVVVSMAVLGVILDRTLERMFLDDLTDSLARGARAVQEALPADAAALQPAVAGLGRELGVRITVVRSDGVVLADSRQDPATMVNDAGRPEVRAALGGRIGVATRSDETVGEQFRYAALPVEDDRVVRVALPTARVHSRLGRVRAVVAGGAALGALAALVVLSLAARRLTRPLGGMTEAAAAVAGGDLARRVPVEGTADVATLAETINRMADELGARIEEAMRDRRTRDLILGAMGEGVLLLDAAGTVQYGNPAAAVILGRSPHPGEPARGVLPAALGRLVGEARADGRPRVEEIAMGPSPRTVEASGVPLGGGPILVVLRDVTETRRVEALRRDFVADASHELKTPAAAILASAETLRVTLDADPDAARGFAKRLEQDARRLSRLVTDLLDLSRLEAERPELEPVRLDDVAREEIERTAPDAAAGGVSVVLDAPDVVTVRGSRKDLALLLRNLLDNAIRYTARGGHAEVSVSRGDGRAVLSVRDDGMGIATRDLPRVFERFYRVDKARSRGTGGTGLGLAIVKHVAERHGGRVEAESELGRGSTFRVILPAAE